MNGFLSTGIEPALQTTLSVLLLVAVFTDLRSQRIPNFLTFPGMIVALAMYSAANGFGGFLFSLKGFAIGLGILLIPHLMGGMGAGDVKLMGAVGSFLGAKATLEAFILIALAGGIYSLALIFIRRDVFKGFFSDKMMALSSMVALKQYVPIQTQNESSGQKPRLKYGVAIAFGTITYLLLKSFGFKFFA